MKRTVLMKRLARLAQELHLEMRVEEGGRHTKVWIGDMFTAVPRHREINELVARQILKEVQR